MLTSGSSMTLMVGGYYMNMRTVRQIMETLRMNHLGNHDGEEQLAFIINNWLREHEIHSVFSAVKELEGKPGLILVSFVGVSVMDNALLGWLICISGFERQQSKSRSHCQAVGTRQGAGKRGRHDMDYL